MTYNHASLAAMFRWQADRLGARTALRHKRWGIYCDLSWEDYRRLVDLATYGWLSLGISRGDRIALLSENRFEWLVADLSILAVGAADVSIHAPLTASQVAYQLSDSGARWIVVSSAEQLEKVREISADLPTLEGVVAFDAPSVPDSVRGSAGGSLQYITWAGLLMRGRQAAAQVAPKLGERDGQIGTSDLAAVMYTSGTTGEPKGVMLSHGNLLSNVVATYEALP